MDLDGVLSLILLVLHWRVALCLVVSSAIAFVLVHFFPWLNGLQGIAIALLGLVAGVAWETQATVVEPAKSATPPQTSASVAFASALLAGGTWGAISSVSMPSFLAGAVIFALAAWGWLRYAGASQTPMPSGRALLCIVTAAVAFPIAAAVAHDAL